MVRVRLIRKITGRVSIAPENTKDIIMRDIAMAKNTPGYGDG